MAHESFEDDVVAEYLNDNFVCIKLDREDRTDIDHLYMEACVAINGQGGWPLSVFLNHDKSPFFAGTYFPKELFMTLLANISSLWKESRDKLLSAGGETFEFLTRPTEKLNSAHWELIEQCYKSFGRCYDPQYGGFGSAPKFPSVQKLLFLLRYASLHPESCAGEMVSNTLRRMADGGIFDHLGGGFFRYSTDRRWGIPHYEKMLYDNALLIIAYSEAAVFFDDESFARIARRCVDFCLAELRAERGFYSALDADSPEGEGAYYLWPRDEVMGVLGEKPGMEFSEQYNIDAGKSLPNLIDKSGEVILPTASLDKLYRHRQSRQRPSRDEKIPASGNSLMVAALSIAGKYLNEPSWVKIAGDTADFILEKMCLDGRLKSSVFAGKASHKAPLDDYAYFVWGLIELYNATFEPKWLGLALNWNAHMLELFGGVSGGLFLSGRDAADMPVRQKAYADGAVPSGNATAAQNLIRLWSMCEDDKYKHLADDIISAAGSELESSPISCAGLLTAILLSGNVSKLTISAGQGQESLINAAGGYRPFLQLIVGSEDKPEARNRVTPSVASALPVNGKAAAYYCDRAGCRKPVTEEKQLLEMLYTQHY